jgi:hypothetical protein
VAESAVAWRSIAAWLTLSAGRREVVVAGGVFINYRGEDSHSYGALLYAELSRHFGAELVFLDSESIPAGADFPEQLLARVRGCAVLLAVVRGG